MNGIREQLIAKVRSALPGSTVYWEHEPAESGLDGAVLSAEYQHRKFTMQFEKAAESTTDRLTEEAIDSAHEIAGSDAPSSTSEIGTDNQDGNETADQQEDLLIEQIVDDFTDFFSRTIYPKEKFTRII
jgi:hypothetical protein